MLNMTAKQKHKYSEFCDRMLKRMNAVPPNASMATRRAAAHIGPAEDAFMRKTLTKRQYHLYRVEVQKTKRQTEDNIRMLKQHQISRM